MKHWTLDLNQNELAQTEIKDFRIMKSINSNDHENLTMNEYFSKTLQNTFKNGFNNKKKLRIN